MLTLTGDPKYDKLIREVERLKRRLDDSMKMRDFWMKKSEQFPYNHPEYRAIQEVNEVLLARVEELEAKLK